MAGAILLWIGAIVAGMTLVIDHEVAPGPSAAAVSDWPADTKLTRAAGRPTLVVFAHPMCPCTRPSLNNFREALARAGSAAAVTVVLMNAAAGEDWSDAPIARDAGTIPGVAIVADPGSVEARRFGVETSGHTLLYDADGRRLFSGGLTASRGHEGGSEGFDRLVGLLQGRAVTPATTPVFGCGLMNATPGDAVPAPGATSRE